ncbi:tRNA pseudouridine(13) synthase TruD [Myxococcota bacterium]|nr:tRNA pseudouridine(13) synthase TruD [Myxococcota bacterium]
MTTPDAFPRFTIRHRPEDFVVVEEPLYPASGSGHHLFLEIEKRGRTTEQVARELARRLAVEPMDVGYAGRKDRHALTRQWFSVPEVEVERALSLELEGARVLAATPHEHKLRTGHLRGNRFELAVRCDAPFDAARLAPRVAELIRRGLPNRYGEQRFGRSGDNAEEGRKLFSGKLRGRDLRAARFLLSALQAEVFNAVLAARSDDYDDVRVGDLARVEASGGLFWVEDLERERPRACAFEISATGPIFGTKVRAPRGEVARLEEEILERHGIKATDRLVLPRGLRALGTRRPLRVAPRELEVLPLDDGHGFRLRCALPSGAYVTVLLEALVGRVGDAGREAASGDEADSLGVSSPDAA